MFWLAAAAFWLCRNALAKALAQAAAASGDDALQLIWRISEFAGTVTLIFLPSCAAVRLASCAAVGSLCSVCPARAATLIDGTICASLSMSMVPLLVRPPATPLVLAPVGLTWTDAVPV